MTWQESRCQGFFWEFQLVANLGGYFYMGAYASGQMRVTRRPVSGQAKLASCVGAETDLFEGLGMVISPLGIAGFGEAYGYHSCVTIDPVEPTTWGRIKVRLADR